MSSVAQKNRRTALWLSLLATGLFIYSFFIIRTRGRIPEPNNLTKAQRILRGL